VNNGVNCPVQKPSVFMAKMQAILLRFRQSETGQQILDCGPERIVTMIQAGRCEPGNADTILTDTEKAHRHAGLALLLFITKGTCLNSHPTIRILAHSYSGGRVGRIFAVIVAVGALLVACLFLGYNKVKSSTQEQKQLTAIPKPLVQNLALRGGESKEVVLSRMKDLGFDLQGCGPEGFQRTWGFEAVPDAASCKFIRSHDEKVEVFLHKDTFKGFDYRFDRRRFPQFLDEVTKTYGEPFHLPDESMDYYLWYDFNSPIDIQAGEDINHRGYVAVDIHNDSEMKLPSPFPLPRAQAVSPH
jgi:hypothetical protein